MAVAFVTVAFLLVVPRAQADPAVVQTTTVYGLRIGNGHTWTIVFGCDGSLSATGYQNFHNPDENITATLADGGTTISFTSTYVGGWAGSPYSWYGSFPVNGGPGTAHTDTYTKGSNFYTYNAAITSTSTTPCNLAPPNPAGGVTPPSPAGGVASSPTANVIGATVPVAAREVLTQADLVSGVCAMAKWRAGELFAAVDAVAATQPAAERALASAGIAYTLPTPQGFRDRGNAGIAGICGAATVDEALARQQALIDVNTDMEAKYGALSEALGGAIKTYVDQKEGQIRAEISAFVDNERKKAETALSVEAEALAQRYVADIRASAQAQLGGQAAAMGASGASPATITAAMTARITELKASAQAEVEAKVQAALADRIAQSKARITDDANKMGDAIKEKTMAQLKPVGDAFDRMLNEVRDRVNAARTADTPERRAATEIRVRLALKTADVFWERARPTIEANRAELAAAKAAGTTALDADGIVALWQTQRAQLDQKLRAAVAAGDETGFVAATLAFQRAWEEMAAGVDRVLGVWPPQRICDAARPGVEQARSQLSAALQQIKDAQQPARDMSTAGDQGARVTLLQQALERGATNFAKYVGNADAVLNMCKAPQSAEPHALFQQIDGVRQLQDAARGEIEQIQALAGALQGGAPQ